MSRTVLLPRLLPSAISHHVGDRTAGRSLAAARGGSVGAVDWDEASSTLSAPVADADGAPHHAEAVLTEYEEDAVSRRFQTPGPGGLWRPASSRCDCPVGEACLHVGALLYRTNDLAVRAALRCYPARAHQATPERMADLLDRGHEALAVMERRLGGRDWLVGEAVSLADVALYAYTHTAGRRGGFDMARFPAVGAWLDRVAALPGHEGIGV